MSPYLKSAIISALKRPINRLNGYITTALTESEYIKDSLPATFDPYPFAYRDNRPTEDTISTEPFGIPGSECALMITVLLLT